MEQTRTDITRNDLPLFGQAQVLCHPLQTYKYFHQNQGQKTANLHFSTTKNKTP